MVVSLASTGGAAKIYTVNGGGASGKNAAAWLEQKIGQKNKKRRTGGQGGTGGEGEIRLIQDFDFPEASNKIKSTRDGQFVMATGTYKPRMKVFDLHELSLKTERVTDSENVDFCILSSDWMKTLHLQADRGLELHTQSSMHHRVRMPKHGRALSYHFPSCDAIVGGEGCDVWRFNLEAGRFMKPFELEGSKNGADGGEGGVGVGGGVDVVTGVNAIDINPAHQLMTFGTSTEAGRGTVEMWDPRSRSRAGLLRLPYARLFATSSSSAALLQPALPGVDDTGRAGLSVTALASKIDGLNLAVGTSTGHVLLYDLRANREYLTKDQGYGLPIKKVEWIENPVVSSGEAEAEGGYVASADERVVKIWGKETGTNLVSVNPPMPINDMHVYPSSGLVFLANETSPMTAYYIPQLGPAPKWARFLDNMTEEMENDQEELLYDDYKFVDRQELAALNLDHLIGSNQLKPYMHGFFVDLRLYTKARAIANPFAYAEHRERLIRERLEAEQESRIRGAKKAASGSKMEGVKVNKTLAKKVQALQDKAAKRAAGQEDDDGENKRRRKKKDAAEVPSLLKDDRFGELFTNPDYEIDEQSREFALLNPSGPPKRRAEGESDSDDDDLRPQQADSDSENDTASDSDSGSISDSSQEGDLGYDTRFNKPAPPVDYKRKLPPSRVAANVPTSKKKLSLVAADDSDEDGDAVSKPLSAYQAKASQTFAQRARQQQRHGDGSKGKGKARADAGDSFVNNTMDIIRGGPGGAMEMSFIPQSKSSNQDKEGSDKRSKADEAKAKRLKDKREKNSFGMGMERRGDFGDDDDVQLEGDQESGRKRMRKPMRSASRNVTRQL
ncbi:Small ribosomal subunit biogenesis [Microbotryomycetes sp. JL201]|nr:Small ribosomal subunit biogenesis [Microbotryomycetes sp. JL201]